MRCPLPRFFPASPFLVSCCDPSVARPYDVSGFLCAIREDETQLQPVVRVNSNPSSESKDISKRKSRRAHSQRTGGRWVEFVFSDARKILRELGFSDSECSIYFSLIEKPEGEAVDSLLSNPESSFRDAEDAVRSLVDRGAVRIVSNRLEASEPKRFIQELEESKRAEVSRNIELLTNRGSRLLSILEPLYWEARLGIKPEELLEPLTDLNEMEKRAT